MTSSAKRRRLALKLLRIHNQEQARTNRQERSLLKKERTLFNLPSSRATRRAAARAAKTTKQGAFNVAVQTEGR